MRTKTAVGRILIEDGRATGVELRDGTRITARVVLSNLFPFQSLLSCHPGPGVTFLPGYGAAYEVAEALGSVKRLRGRSAA